MLMIISAAVKILQHFPNVLRATQIWVRWM